MIVSLNFRHSFTRALLESSGRLAVTPAHSSGLHTRLATGHSQATLITGSPPSGRRTWASISSSLTLPALDWFTLSVSKVLLDS